MPDTIRIVDYFYIEAPDKPGEVDWTGRGYPQSSPSRRASRQNARGGGGGAPPDCQVLNVSPIAVRGVLSGCGRPGRVAQVPRDEAEMA